MLTQRNLLILDRTKGKNLDVLGTNQKGEYSEITPFYTMAIPLNPWILPNQVTQQLFDSGTQSPSTDTSCFDLVHLLC